MIYLTVTKKAKSMQTVIKQREKKPIQKRVQHINISNDEKILLVVSLKLVCSRKMLFKKNNF